MTAAWGDPWREECVFFQRVAGALARHAEIEVLLADGGGGPAEEWAGALRIRRFPLRQGSRERRALVYREVFGTAHPEGAFASPWAAELCGFVAAELPELFGREIARAGGGDSPELLETLRRSDYDVVVFCGYRAASTVLGVGEVSGRARTVLVAALREEPEIRLPACTAALPAVDRVLVATPGERQLAIRSGAPAGRVREVGLTVQVHELARTSDPAGLGNRRYVVVADDWAEPRPPFAVASLAERWRRDFEDVALCFAGRGAERLPEILAEHRQRTISRTDLWRWMSKALLVCDPRPYRAFGFETLEAMLCGAPVLVPDRAGASREHAERSGGGLWYRTYAELRGLVETLAADPDLCLRLSQQGRSYVERTFTDPEPFVERVVDAVIG